MDSITVNRNPSSDNELANKNNVDDSLSGTNILSFNQTFENCIKVSAGSDLYNLSKHDKKQIIDTTVSKTGITGTDILPYWKIVCIDENNDGKIRNFVEPTKRHRQEAIQYQQTYLLLVMHSGILNFPPAIPDSILFFVVSNEQLSFKLQIQVSSITDFHFQLMIHQKLWVISEFNFYWKIRHGDRGLLYLK